MTAMVSGGGMFRYTGLHGCSSMCRFTLVETGMLSPSLCVVITSSRQNRGTSITNMAEGIATEFFRAKLPGANPDDILWVEHYPPCTIAGRRSSRRLDVVRVQWVPRLPLSDRPGYQFENSTNGWRPLERALQGEQFGPLRACIEEAADQAEALEADLQLGG